MKCNSCGENVADTAKFCENCGARLAVPAPEPTVEPVVEHTVEPIADIPIVSNDAGESPAQSAPNAAPITQLPTEDMQASAENTDASKSDLSREQAYLNYEKKLHEIRQQQTDAAIAAVPVAAAENSNAISEEKPTVTVSEEPAVTVSTEILPTQPNAVVMAGKSGIFAAANVLFTINTVLTALVTVGSVLLGAGGTIAAIVALSEYFGVDLSSFIDAAVGDTMGIAVLIGVSITILANIPNILLNIGLCTTRSACKRSNGENIRPTGLKLIRAVSVIGIVFTALICAVALCVAILFITGDSYTRAIGITLLIFTAITIIAAAFCFAKLMDSLNRAIDTAEGYYEKKASTFLGVLCIIAAVFSLINIIGCLALIFYAVTLFKYNSIVGSRNAE